MIRKIKEYFATKHRRKKLEYEINREVLETLVTICMYLAYEGHFSRNQYAEYCNCHINPLKYLSEECKYEAGVEKTQEDKFI